MFKDRCLLIVFFLLAIVLSVLLRSTDDDYLIGIFKLFFVAYVYMATHSPGLIQTLQ
jgi:hypothetical protein